MDYRLELILLPVADVDRAKEFYERAGFNLDVDHSRGEDFRVVQFTPRGSSCSITFGIGLELDTEPGSVQGLHLVVEDIEAARSDLVDRGVEVGEIRHMSPEGWQPGPDPSHARYNSFAAFADPDGNGWILQEVPAGS